MPNIDYLEVSSALDGNELVRIDPGVLVIRRRQPLQAYAYELVTSTRNRAVQSCDIHVIFEVGQSKCDAEASVGDEEWSQVL